jgi:dCTP deaminase
MDKRVPSLLPKAEPATPRKHGVLPAQEIRELIRNGKIRYREEIADSQIQPASIDLRLGDRAYRVKASFLPKQSSLIGPRIRELALEEIDLTHPAVLHPGSVYIARTAEYLALPHDVAGKANPKSTTGRLDIFTRLLTDGQPTFEIVPKGYAGDLYVEIFPRTFPIIVRAGAKLNQLRFFRGDPQRTDRALSRLGDRKPLVYENGGTPHEAMIRGGLRMCVDLSGPPERIVAYKARRTSKPIDLALVGSCEATEFWKASRAKDVDRAGGLVLSPGEFYLLASKERVVVPADYAAEMESYDPSIGEFTVHYAGFFDPGFGYGESGEIKGTNAVLEVRAHEVPILLEDAREIGRLIYHKMAARPDKTYGVGIGSSYQQQELALPKQFRKLPATKSAAELQPSVSQN